MKFARWHGGLALLSVALVASACSGTTTQPPSGQRQDQTFTYDANSQIIVGWDPATENSNSILALANVYETLTRYDSTTKTVRPLLATSWSASSDGLTWTFKIREGVYFHSGKALTAADVKASIDRTIELAQGAAYIWSGVKSIEAPDSQSVVFHLKYPSPIDLVASGGYAAYVYDTQAAGGQNLNKWFESGNEAGSGPYMLDSWKKGQEVEVRLVAFPKYWGGWTGTHYKNVAFRVTPEATTAAQLLRSGQVSFVEQLTPQLFATFKDDPGFMTTETASWQNLLALLNTRTGPLSDASVREAVANAIDYPGLLAALHGAGSPSSGVVPPGLWGHFDDLSNYSYDPARAGQLLNAAGYGPGGKPITLTLTYTQGDANEQLFASLLKSNLGKLNITLNVQPLAWPTQWAKAKSPDTATRQDILVFYWWPDYADPISWFANLFHCEAKPYWNLAYYCNAGLDRLIDNVETYAATDRPKAVQMYKQMQTILLRDSPALPLYNVNYQYAMLSSVEGFTPNPAYANVAFVYDLTPTA